MKKHWIVIAVFMLVALFSVSSFAASSMTPSIYEMTGGTDNQEWPDRIVILVDLISDTDGTFTAAQITDAHIPSRKLGERPDIDYWNAGYYIGDARLINGAASYPNVAGALTVTDEDGRQLIGATCGDTLAASTAQSGVGYLTATRSAAQRDVTSKLTVAVGDTQSGTATTVNKLKLVLVR